MQKHGPRKSSAKKRKTNHQIISLKDNIHIEREHPSYLSTKKSIFLIVVCFFSLFYLEITFKIFNYGLVSIFKINTIILMLFLLPLSCIITILSKLTTNPKKNKMIYLVILGLFTVWTSISLIFKKVFNTYFCLSLFGLSDQAIAFTVTALLEILKNIILLIILFIPFFLSLFLSKYIDFKKLKKKSSIMYILLLFIPISVLEVIIYSSKTKDNSLYMQIHSLNNNAVNIETLGVFPAFYLDLKDLITSKSTTEIELPSYNVDTKDEEETPDEKVYEPNTVDINFENLIATEKNKALLSMHKYFASDKGTFQNEYTGLFKDKNLIVIMAESLNTIGIRADVTPTLYKLATEGFNFTNFYTPVNLSTIGGEFQNLTSLFANLNDLNKYFRKGTNYFPFGLGTVFKNNGYNVKAYHANDAYFQDRIVYLKNMGFNYFKAKNTGLEKLMDCNKWPQSDEEMVNATMNEYINDEKFLTYYVSVSSHMPYTKNGNAIVSKNWSLVQDLNYSDEAKGYLASVIELDKAVNNLITSLEDNGKLDDTVIAIIPDHYPYSLSLNAINELSDYKRDATIEVNHSSLIIWNSKTSSVTITKTASQLDFLPTLYNLFGLSYDSRLFMGKDILSNEPGLAYFQNKSWITDKGTYFANSNKFVPKDGNIFDDEYVSKINKIVDNRIKMSKLIIDNDYYSKVLKSE